MFGRDKKSEPAVRGGWGEKQAEKYLLHHGFSLVSRNFRCKTGEIDLIMQEADGSLVFVEVKARRSEMFTAAEEVINTSKKRRLKRAARYFLSRYPSSQDRPLRFDVVLVMGEEKNSTLQIRHYRNVFR